MITPNRLTAVRILFALIIPFLLAAPRSLTNELLAIGLFTAACITDWWDGHMARTRGMVTRLGKLIDPLADKMLVLGAMACFVYRDLYSFWWIVPILARELIVTGVRVALLQRGQVVPAETGGKIKFGFQVGSVYASFIYLMLEGTPMISSGAPAVLAVFRFLNGLGIALANLATLYSGAGFFYTLWNKRSA